MALGAKKAKKKDKRALKNENNPEAIKGIWTVLLAALSVFILLSFIGKGGSVGDSVKGASNAAAGIGMYFLPIFVIWFALIPIITFNRRQKIIFSSSLLSFFSVLGIIHLISEDAGGVLGYALSGFAAGSLGDAGSIAIFLAIIISSVVFNFNISLIKIFSDIRKREYRKGRSLEVSKEEIESFFEEKSDEPDVEGESFKKDDKGLQEQDAKEEDNKEETIFAAGGASGFRLPSFDLLQKEISKPKSGNIGENVRKIKNTLETFGIRVEMGDVNVGPTVTRYTIKPAQGVRLSKITALSSDIALALAAKSLRIEAPIPGRSLVGLEIPNKETALTRLRPLLEKKEFQEAGDLAIALGRDVSGRPIYSDLTKMPHLLIAGSTGSGKTISVTTLILSLLYKNTPQQLRLILLDPKRVEFGVYANIPHLLAPVVTENSKAINALKWAVSEMERRFDILNRVGARDITAYRKNKEAVEQEGLMPYLVVIIDEFADLMAVKGKEAEGLVVRIAQLARAAGIHLVIATQRPSVEVITGIIKANLPSRMAFSMASQVDSRTILDSQGAEKLLGKGDMLFIPPQSSIPVRIQGAFVEDKEVKRVVEFIRAQVPLEEAQSFDDKDEKTKRKGDVSINQPVDFGAPVSSSSANSIPEDNLYESAKEVVIKNQKASASMLQRRLRVGYARAARLLDLLEENNIIGPADGARPRDVYEKSEEESYGGPVAKE